MNTPKDSIEITEPSTAPNVEITIAGMINDTIKLKRLLELETNHLKKMEMKKVRELHDVKMKLIRRLEIQKDFVKKDKSLTQNIAPLDRVKIRRLESEMEAIVKDNFIEVIKAKEVNQRVVEVISKEVIKQQATASGYDNAGLEYGGKMKIGGSAGAMALNETI